jgi:hypothetical protein
MERKRKEKGQDGKRAVRALKRLVIIQASASLSHGTATWIPRQIPCSRGRMLWNKDIVIIIIIHMRDSWQNFVYHHIGHVYVNEIDKFAWNALATPSNPVTYTALSSMMILMFFESNLLPSAMISTALHAAFPSSRDQPAIVILANALESSYDPATEVVSMVLEKENCTSANDLTTTSVLRGTYLDIFDIGGVLADTVVKVQPSLRFLLIIERHKNAPRIRPGCFGRVARLLTCDDAATAHVYWDVLKRCV